MKCERLESSEEKEKTGRTADSTPQGRYDLAIRKIETSRWKRTEEEEGKGKLRFFKVCWSCRADFHTLDTLFAIEKSQMARPNLVAGE